MNTSAFILASGDHTRWFGETCKQLVEIDGEPLLTRTLRQFQDLEPWVVAKDGIVMRHAKKQFQIIHSECLCDTVLQTRPLWTDKVCFLLGDVYFTDDCARRIRNQASCPAFFTDGVDVFAMVFSWVSLCSVPTACMEGIKDNRARKTDGKAWDIYRYFIPAVKHWPLNPTHTIPFTEFVSDRTQDFDAVEEYKAFKAGKSKNALHG